MTKIFEVYYLKCTWPVDCHFVIVYLCNLFCSLIICSVNLQPVKISTNIQNGKEIGAKGSMFWDKSLNLNSIKIMAFCKSSKCIVSLTVYFTLDTQYTRTPNFELCG